MEPIDYAGVLRRSWRLLLLLAVVGAVIAAVIPVSHPKRVKSALPYSATALVATPPNSTGSPLKAGVGSTQIAYFANLSSTQQTVASDVGLNIPVAALPAYMTASVIPAAGVATGGASAILKRNAPTNVQFIGFGATPEQAILVANTFASDTGDAVEAGLASSPRTAGIPSGYHVSHPALSAASTAAPRSSLKTSRKVRVLSGFAVGAVLAAVLVLLRELLDKRLRSAARAEANFGFPVIAEIPVPALAGQQAAGLLPVVDVIRSPESAGAEAYRMLRMSVLFENLAPLSGPIDPFAAGFDGNAAGLLAMGSGTEATPTTEIGARQVILVVSAGSEPTRPHVAANLAAIYGEAGQRVVVISTGDLEAGVGGANGANGFTEIRTEDIEARLEPSRLACVSRLPLGPFVANSGQLVDRAPAIIEAARSLSDVVIVEVPPMLALHHAEAMAHLVDVVLVVAECKFTTFDDARNAGDLLRRMGAPVLGVALTNVRLRHSDVRQLALVGSPKTEETEVDHDGEAAHAIGVGVGSAPDSTHL
jgi:Mrp family chromosome partitioning ATPase